MAHVAPGLNLVSRIAADKKVVVEVVDMSGNSVHTWDVDWFRIWPDAEHLDSDVAPKARPGTHIHGAVLLDNGNLVYNYDHLGLVCLDFETANGISRPIRTCSTRGSVVSGINITLSLT